MALKKGRRITVMLPPLRRLSNPIRPSRPLHPSLPPRPPFPPDPPWPPSTLTVSEPS
jgi:hypothetical protein